MSPDEIQHFLLSFNPENGRTEVREFGTDIVLISADSLKTIEHTHSSYFRGNSTGLYRLLDPASR